MPYDRHAHDCQCVSGPPEFGAVREPLLTATRWQPHHKPLRLAPIEVVSVRKRIILITLVISVSFNVLAAFAVNAFPRTSQAWLFPDLGPGVLQDSYYSRAPALESLFGAIGDVPGGYSLYAGSPLQGGFSNNLSTWMAGSLPWSLSTLNPHASVPLAAIVLAFVPLLAAFIIGRRSYGSTKTR